jgi:hypothetical protein
MIKSTSCLGVATPTELDRQNRAVGLRVAPCGDLENTAADTPERLCIFGHFAELDEL